MAELKQLHQGQSDLPAVVFVHGLGGDWIDTWRHPQARADDMWLHWVGQDSECDVWTVRYDAAISAWVAQAMPITDQAVPDQNQSLALQSRFCGQQVGHLVRLVGERHGLRYPGEDGRVVAQCPDVALAVLADPMQPHVLGAGLRVPPGVDPVTTQAMHEDDGGQV